MSSSASLVVSEEKLVSEDDLQGLIFDCDGTLGWFIQFSLAIGLALPCPININFLT